MNELELSSNTRAIISHDGVDLTQTFTNDNEEEETAYIWLTQDQLRKLAQAAAEQLRKWENEA